MKELIELLLAINEKMASINGVVVASVSGRSGVIKIIIDADRRILHEQIQDILPSLDVDYLLDYDMRTSTHTITLNTR